MTDPLYGRVGRPVLFEFGLRPILRRWSRAPSLTSRALRLVYALVKKNPQKAQNGCEHACGQRIDEKPRGAGPFGAGGRVVHGKGEIGLHFSRELGLELL